MEQNLPIIAKKVWSLMQVMFLMLKKNISKTKFLIVDLDMIMKGGKIAGKSLHNLLFHHWATAATTTIHRRPHHLSLISTHKKHQNKKHHSTTAPPPVDDGSEMIITPAVMKALEMLTGAAAVAVSPGARFGKSTPRVKELRITDSPYPLSNGDGDGKVDEAAEKFILRFYNDLRRQN